MSLDKEGLVLEMRRQHEDFLEAIADDFQKDVMRYPDDRLAIEIYGPREKRAAAGKRLGFIAVAHGRHDDAIHLFRQGQSEFLGDDGIRRQRQMLRMLLGRANRQDDDIVFASGELGPTHFIHIVFHQ